MIFICYFQFNFAGLGAAPAKHHDHVERLSSVEKQIIELKGGKVEKPIVAAPMPSSSYVSNRNEYVGRPPEVRDRDRDRAEKDKKKAEKKERKREKKEHKKEKKEHKKEKKREKDKRQTLEYETY